MLRTHILRTCRSLRISRCAQVMPRCTHYALATGCMPAYLAVRYNLFFCARHTPRAAHLHCAFFCSLLILAHFHNGYRGSSCATYTHTAHTSHTLHTFYVHTWVLPHMPHITPLHTTLPFLTTFTHTHLHSMAALLVPSRHTVASGWLDHCTLPALGSFWFAHTRIPLYHIHAWFTLMRCRVATRVLLLRIALRRTRIAYLIAYARSHLCRCAVACCVAHIAHAHRCAQHAQHLFLAHSIRLTRSACAHLVSWFVTCAALRARLRAWFSCCITPRLPPYRAWTRAPGTHTATAAIAPLYKQPLFCRAAPHAHRHSFRIAPPRIARRSCVRTIPPSAHCTHCRYTPHLVATLCTAPLCTLPAPSFWFTAPHHLCTHSFALTCHTGFTPHAQVSPHLALGCLCSPRIHGYHLHTPLPAVFSRLPALPRTTRRLRTAAQPHTYTPPCLRATFPHHLARTPHRLLCLPFCAPLPARTAACGFVHTHAHHARYHAQHTS